MKQKSRNIQFKKIELRGDEIRSLFAAFLFSFFWIFSAFRLLPIGKLIDDFAFTLLFGWSKYLIYILLLVYFVPLFFNHYLKISGKFWIIFWTSILLLSWTIQNSVMISSDPSIWSNHDASFSMFTNYWNSFWTNSIINNYHGFLVNPISFDNWTSISSFFPAFASGGFITNIIVDLLSTGFFVTNFMINMIILTLFTSWMLTGRTLLVFHPFFFFWKKQKAKRQSPKKQEQIIEKQVQPLLVVETKEEQVVKETIKTPTMPIMKEIDAIKDSRLNLQQEYFAQNNTNLTPFGEISYPKRAVKVKVGEPVKEAAQTTLNDTIMAPEEIFEQLQVEQKLEFENKNNYESFLNPSSSSDLISEEVSEKNDVEK